MSDDLKSQLGNFWNGILKKKDEMISHTGANLTLGKVVSKDFYDKDGKLLVVAGGKIDQSVLDAVNRDGKMHELLAIVVTAQVQDQQEKMKTAFEATPEGIDAHNSANSEQYLEARAYIRYVAAIDVTDIRGNILVPAGKEIDDEDVRLARDEDQLASLVYSAQQSGKPVVYEGSDPFTHADPSAGPALKRTPLPLGETYERGIE